MSPAYCLFQANTLKNMKDTKKHFVKNLKIFLLRRKQDGTVKVHKRYTAPILSSLGYVIEKIIVSNSPQKISGRWY